VVTPIVERRFEQLADVRLWPAGDDKSEREWVSGVGAPDRAQNFFVNVMPFALVQPIDEDRERVLISVVQATRLQNELLELSFDGSPNDGWIVLYNLRNGSFQPGNPERELVRDCCE
jgi:hypothetical protein